MKRIELIAPLLLLAAITLPGKAAACTGISLKAGDGTHVYARTIEWGGNDLDSRYVIVPRGYGQRSYLPDGSADGMLFKARHGYVGLSVQQKEIIAEGVNERGLSAGLFYFPGYGRYEQYDPTAKASTIADIQLVSLILGSCADVEEVRRTVAGLHVVGIVPEASTVHWRFADAKGGQIVLEFIDGTARIYDNRVGVLTNSPSFDWQMTNLNNYVNLYTGSAPTRQIDGTTLAQFGAGGGMLGLPGDITPPSRFVRAFFMKASAPQYDTAEQTVFQTFGILNNFDIPIGLEFSADETPAPIPSATQWTSSCDTRTPAIYYRTMYDSSIRRIDLSCIDFSKVKYTHAPLDAVRRQPVTDIAIK